MTATPGAPRVSTDDVRHVAELANLQLTEDELPRMARDLDAVLAYIDQLNELDTAEIAAMAQVGEVLGQEVPQHGESLRRDERKASLDRAAVMAEAPATDGRFFQVPKVIER